ncbi:unnamed protein product [Moneuplotes crassus]|uniref:Uncharacterized protein n=1 Tax=Euplotes crassus TaxID=5936 RepID=A0AAD1USW3_EUPCR|nr:unnamed protein product [Moneuplotes crassus]
MAKACNGMNEKGDFKFKKIPRIDLINARSDYKIFTMNTKSKPKISLLKNSQQSIEKGQNSTKFTDNLESLSKSPLTLKSQSIFHKRKTSSNPRRHLQIYDASHHIQHLELPQKGLNFQNPLLCYQKPHTSKQQYKPECKTSPFSVEHAGDSPLLAKPSCTFKQIFKPRVVQRPVKPIKVKIPPINEECDISVIDGQVEVVEVAEKEDRRYGWMDIVNNEVLQ